jgi:hypothetical protein
LIHCLQRGNDDPVDPNIVGIAVTAADWENRIKITIKITVTYLVFLRQHVRMQIVISGSFPGSWQQLENAPSHAVTYTQMDARRAPAVSQ